MIVWRTKNNDSGYPRHLVGCANVKRRDDMVWVSKGIASPPPADELSWHDIADNWQCAMVPGTQVEPVKYLRNRKWSLCFVVEDARGTLWQVPAILHPNGSPIYASVRRLTADGWVADAVDEYAQASISACESALPHLDDLGSVDIDTQMSWICQLFEGIYHLDALTMGKLGLIDDVLKDKGLKAASGLVDPTKYGHEMDMING